MAVIRIERLGLAVRGLDAMARFYGDAFGCAVIAREAERASLRLGRQIIELAGFDPPGAPWPDDQRSNDVIFQHFAIAVADMAEAYTHLMTVPGWRAISFDGPVKLPPSSGGVTAFKFRDPEGHPLELLEFPDPPKRPGGGLFYEINHTAIVVKDTRRSLDFYAGALGLVPGEGSRNTGGEQGLLDDLEDPNVRVTPLRPRGQPTPHVELLCYDEPPSRGAAPGGKSPRDAIATKIIFAADDPDAAVEGAITAGGTLVARALIRDPDGHDVVMEAA